MDKVIIKILGVGCPKCRRLKQKIHDVINKHHIDAEVIEVTNIDDMLQYGYMMTPGLVINEKLVSFGMVPKEDQILHWLKHPTE